MITARQLQRGEGEPDGDEVVVVAKHMLQVLKALLLGLQSHVELAQPLVAIRHLPQRMPQLCAPTEAAC